MHTCEIDAKMKMKQLPAPPGWVEEYHRLIRLYPELDIDPMLTHIEMERIAKSRHLSMVIVPYGCVRMHKGIRYAAKLHCILCHRGIKEEQTDAITLFFNNLEERRSIKELFENLRANRNPDDYPKIESWVIYGQKRKR